jgi:hypothetical protein
MVTNEQLSHYGKNVNELTELERDLMSIDGLMVINFSVSNKDEILWTSLLNNLGRRRVELLCLIMGVSFKEVEDTETELEFLEMIEMTEYSFTRFQLDLNRNLEISYHRENIVQLN